MLNIIKTFHPLPDFPFLFLLPARYSSYYQDTYLLLNHYTTASERFFHWLNWTLGSAGETVLSKKKKNNNNDIPT